MKDKALYLIIGVLLGVIIMQWRQGPPPAQAQAPEPINGYRIWYNNGTSLHYVMLSNGEVYCRQSGDDWSAYPPQHLGNFWSGPPVPTTPSTMGDMKSRYGDGKQ